MNAAEPITVNLFDWTGGIRNKRQNPLLFPENALMNGEDIDLVDGRLRTRRGASWSSSGSLASGAVQVLTQARLPTSEASYLLAQVDDGSGNRLYASPTLLPTSAGQFVEIFDLGSGAGPVSIASLNDRVVITEGKNHRPLVFLGCMAPAGEDWAVPKAVIVSYDSGVNWHDISAAVCDNDPATAADLGEFPSSGYLAICADVPKVSAFAFDVGVPNVNLVDMTIEGYSGSWSSGSGWSDGTASGGVSFAQSGCCSYSGAEPFEASYHTIFEVPGFWYRLRFAGVSAHLSSGASLRRVLFKAPCQELQVIGDGQPDSPLGFIYYDDSATSAKDWTVQVSDYTIPSVARLNDGAVSGAVGMQPGDFIYVGYLTPFNLIEITPSNDNPNTSGAALLGQYWNGTGWTSLSITDGTAVSGKTLATKGKIGWSAPPDWQQIRPIERGFPRGYWIRLGVNANLRVDTYLSECAVYPIPEALAKHQYAMTMRDRMVLLNRPDAADQIGITRALEEYGMFGEDSASLRIGGQDEIVGAVEAFNQGFIAKPDAWYILNGYSPQTFAAERAETANQAPVTNRVIVTGPFAEADQKNKMGIYFINHFGAWHFTGLQVYQLSRDVSWWDPSAGTPRLDLNNLFRSYGVYWPERNWIIWAVPMIVGQATSQATNNRLIIYDLVLQTWLPPFSVSAASLCTAFHHHESAPGKRGEIGLYAGDYAGNVLRLFGPTDLHADGWVETGWMAYGAPKTVKLLRHLTAYGKGALTLKIFTDGNERSAARQIELSGLSAIGPHLFAVDQDNVNLNARFFKYRIELRGDSDLYGLGLEFAPVRGWDAM